MAQKLDDMYLVHWRKARTDTTRHGRLPGDLRDENGSLREDFSLAAQFPLTGDAPRLCIAVPVIVLEACHVEANRRARHNLGLTAASCAKMMMKAVLDPLGRVQISHHG